jgi:hypothetical protein
MGTYTHWLRERESHGEREVELAASSEWMPIIILILTSCAKVGEFA